MQKEKIESNPLLKLSFEFSLQLIEYCEVLEDKRKFVIARQLLKSGTSIGANSMEAQNAESKADFIQKLLQKKRKKHNIGYNYATFQKAILNVSLF